MTQEVTGNEIETITDVELARHCYAEYGAYANSTRVAVGIDGLLPVYRRILLSARDESKGEEVSSAKVVGTLLGNYHPHGDSSAYSSLVRLVNRGILTGKGNFGSIGLEPQPAAAMRYTKVKAPQPFLDSVFRFVPFVEKYENEFGIQEPEYLPVPIPLVLTYGHIGLGVGVQAQYPQFKASSIFDAMINDDYTLLKSKDRSFLDKNTDLERIWNDGEGWVRYGIKCYEEHSALENKNVTVIEGNQHIMIPDIKKEFEKELSDNTVYFRDESSSYMRIVVSRVKDIRRITDTEVYERCKKLARRDQHCRLYISGKNQVVRRISLRNWLRTTWENYVNVHAKWKESTTNNLLHRKRIYELIPQVGPHVINNVKSEEIATILGIDLALVKEIEGKAIRMLRVDDYTPQINKIDAEIQAVSLTTPELFAKEFIDIIEEGQKL